MYVLTVLFFLILPAGMAGFLFWRAYQLGVKGRVELARQWMFRPPKGIEAFAPWFAWRDGVAATGWLVCLLLLLAWPQYFAAWLVLMGLPVLIHQAVTGYAIQKLAKS